MRRNYKFFDLREREGKEEAMTGKPEQRKGTRWMPWRSLAKKDVVSCEKLRVGANSH